MAPLTLALRNLGAQRGAQRVVVRAACALCAMAAAARAALGADAAPPCERALPSLPASLSRSDSG
jgi:hypothetical protein